VRHAYPRQLASFVRSRWSDEPGLPPAHQLEAILSIAYQASVLRDEDRPVAFRLVLAPPEAFAEDSGPPAGVLALPFDVPRRFDEHELRRLSQAAKYHRTLIGVSAASNDHLAIWGVVHTGPRWLPSARAGEQHAPALPAGALIVRAPAPGRLEVARGLATIAEMRGGVITEPGLDVFEARWLAARFADIREEVVALHRAALAEHAPLSGPLGHESVRLIGQDVVRRTLAIMREARHGGTLLFLPPDAAEPARMPPFLEVKYGFRAGAARRRYRAAMLELLHALATERPDARSTVAEANEAVFEISQLIAALADVDGAVVLTRRFELVGFGAEIVGALPPVERVARAVDLEGDTRALEPPDDVGTRHRSAYRLVAAVPEVLAIVVSQDGAVEFVAQLGGHVTVWDHSASG
jgi:sensor domain DACNV-containing protein